MGTLLQNKTLKMFKLLVVAVLAVAVSALTKQELDTEWDIYKTQHNKKYARGEEVIRRGIWEYHLGYIQKHNLEADRGVHTFWLGMNEYGDMSNEEFVKTMVTVCETPHKALDPPTYHPPISEIYQILLTGEKKDTSLKLKIRDNAVHVGHSLPPDHLKVNISRRTRL